MGVYEEKLDLLNTDPSRTYQEWKPGNPVYDYGIKIEEIYNQFGVCCDAVDYREYPSHYEYFLRLLPGCRYQQFTRLIPDFSLACGVPVTCECEDGLIKVIVPVKDRQPIYLRDFRIDEEYKGVSGFSCFYLGDNTPVDLAKCPHLLIAGSSGSGKSVCLNSIIMTMLLRNDDTRAAQFIMIDPKKVELNAYEGIQNLLCPIANTIEQARGALVYANQIMRERYDSLAREGLRSIDDWADKHGKHMSRIIVVIDELADLMLQDKKNIEPLLVTLAQEGRAAGVHLVIATQEPTVNVITGLIKANIPARVALKTSTSKESVVILGHKGAEDLFGHGDMIYKPSDGSPEKRMQGVFVSTEEVKRMCDYLRAHEPVKKLGFFARLFRRTA